MACAGVVASAGAQIQLFFLTTGTKSVSAGKSTFTYRGKYLDAGTVSPTAVTLKNGNIHTVTALYTLSSAPTNIVLQFADLDDGTAVPDSDEAFRSITIGDLKVLRSDRSAYAASSNDQYFTLPNGGNDNIYSVDVGSIVICELRAD